MIGPSLNFKQLFGSFRAERNTTEYWSENSLCVYSMDFIKAHLASNKLLQKARLKMNLIHNTHLAYSEAKQNLTLYDEQADIYI